MARRALTGALALLCAFPALVAAQFATLYLEESSTQFSLNIANDTTEADECGKTYIYFSSPAYSWASIGFGEDHDSPYYFVFYPSKNYDNVTVSPRIERSPGVHAEPVHNADFTDIEILPGTEIKDNMMVVKLLWRTCIFDDPLPAGTRPDSHMMYAFGPARQPIHSDNPAADLRRHSRYGRFVMDLQKAVGKGEVPGPTTASNGVELQGRMTRDHDRANLAHAVLGCIAIFVFWPLSVLVGGFFKRIGIHVGVSVFAVVLLLVSYAVGGVVSYQYERTRLFASPHQIFAFLSIVPILLLSLLPLPALSNLTTQIPRLHAPLASLALFLLILTGGLGLHVSRVPRPVAIAYAALSLLVFAFCVLLQSCIRRRGSAYRRSKRSSRPESTFDSGVRDSPHARTHWPSFVPGSSWLAGRRSRSRRRSRGAARLGEDEQDLVMRQYTGTGSAPHGTSTPPPSYYNTEYARGTPPPGGNPNPHERSGSAGSAKSGNQNIYGGGAMPGPQYMMNMHPGVPVYKP